MNGEIGKPALFPSLEDRVVFITGGGSGIGGSLVEHFCRQRARVTFVDFAEEPSRRLAERIGAAGHTVPTFIACDLRNIDELRKAVEETATKNGPIGVLVNNAGNDDRHRTEDVTVAYWDDRMQVNLRH